jgi:LDH2 family malate/lactate/ureidoglycolate dehydrogenase
LVSEVRIAPGELQELTTRIFAAVGAPEDVAAEGAEHLVQSITVQPPSARPMAT